MQLNLIFLLAKLFLSLFDFLKEGGDFLSVQRSVKVGDFVEFTVKIDFTLSRPTKNEPP